MSRYLIDFSLTNGLGYPSLSLYLTGCDKPIKCEGCHNYELQQKENREVEISNIMDETKDQIKKAQSTMSLRYFSFLGGEPLAPYNREILKEVSKITKEEFNLINILYSWRDHKLVVKKLDEYIRYIDYGVLGAFETELKEENTIPSSSNQYIYNFNQGRKEEKIILNKERMI